jgi:hypothetical protein
MTSSPQAPSGDDNDDDPKFVCFACVGESHLSDIIHESGEEKTCSYCNTEQEAIGIEALCAAPAAPALSDPRPV